MEPSTEELRRHYDGLSDSALLALQAEQQTMTPKAQAVLLRELEQRNLDAPELESQIPPEFEVTAARWVTVDRFRDLSGAIVARGALEAAGIPCFLRDENTVRLDWQISNFIGGMRLQVQEEDRDNALAVLNELTPGEALQGSEALPAGESCPFCGSQAIHRMERGLGLRAAVLWMFSVPLPIGSRYWQCDTCGRQFAEADLDRSEASLE